MSNTVLWCLTSIGGDGVRVFFLYGTIVLLLFGYAQYTGWSWTSVDELHDVPKSIRNNPGIYRSMYSRYPHK
jgi:hypothetical protein